MPRTCHGAQAAPLPAGWKQEQDLRSGRFFYVNHAAKQWSWDAPGESVALDDAASLQTLACSAISGVVSVVAAAVAVGGVAAGAGALDSRKLRWRHGIVSSPNPPCDDTPATAASQCEVAVEQPGSQSPIDSGAAAAEEVRVYREKIRALEARSAEAAAAAEVAREDARTLQVRL